MLFSWTEAEADRSARKLTWTAAWPRPRAILRHAEMTPGSETAADGALVYLRRAATGKRVTRSVVTAGASLSTAAADHSP